MKYRMKYRITVGVAAVAGLVAAGGAAMLTGTASAASTGCSVSYSVASQWPGGF